MSAESNESKYLILDDLEVPAKVLENWQVTIDMLAEIAGIPAALIMRVHAREIEVFLSSHSPGNVYHPGEKAPLDTGLYCETVMRTQRKLVVPNSLKDLNWDHNPAIKLGMISYCGVPLTWPNGEMFGTICILDKQANAFTQQTHHLVDCFRNSIQLSIASIYQSSLARHQKEAAESDLRASETRSQRYLDATRTIMLALDATGCVTMLNRAGQALLGYTETELLGRNWFATCLPQPEGLDTLYPAFQRIMAGELEAFAEYENVVVCRDGRQRLIGWHNSYFRDDAGRIVGILSCGEDITERKRAEESLRTAAAYARSLLEASLDPLVTISAGGKITDVNDASVAVTGVPREQLIGTDFSDYFTEPVKAREGYLRVLSEGFVRDYPLTIRHVFGRMTDVLYNATVYRDAQGLLQGVFAAARDITERQKAAEELRLSEERYRSILNATPDAIAIMDTAGRVVMISPATVTMFGYQRAEELLGKWVTDFIVPEERASAVSNLGLIFRGKSPGLMEYRCLRADGSLFDVEANGEIIRDAAGHHVQMVAIVRDITERKRTQAALRESETNLNRAQAVAHIGSWSLDVAHDILNGSEETRRIFGIAPETPLTYRSFLTCLHPDDQARVDRAWQAALRGAPYDIEHRIVVENQVKWVRERAELEAGADGNIRRALGTVQDITERKQAETALRESEEAALSNNALLHSIMESPQDTVIFALDTSYRYTAFTQAHRRTMRAIWGVEIEAGINMLDAIPNSDAREQARRNFDRALQGHHFIVVEDYGDPALRRTTYENRYGPIHDPAGVVSGLTVFVTDITKRQRAEAALRESDERFRNLLRDVPGVAVQGYRLDGTTTYWNQASETLYGYTAQDAVGRSLLDLVVPPEMQEGVRQAMRQMAETGQPIPASELSLMRKDGSRVAVFSSHVVVQIPGRAAEMFCLDIDLTERKRAEAALRESEDRFRAVVEGAAMPIIVSVGMKFSYLNLAALQLLGATTPEQVLGQPILSRIHPDCHASIQKRAVKVFQGQRGVAPPQAEVYLKLDGTPVPVEATASPITYQGQPAAVVFVQDITERKRLKDSLQELNRSLEQRVAERTAELSLEIDERRQTEERLRASEQRHRDLVETVPDWVWQVDKHAIFTFSGPQSRDLLGYEPEEILGRTPFDFMPPEEAQQVRSFTLPAMMRGEPIQALESVLRRKDGRLITVETNGVPIRDAVGKLRGYRGLVHDITERRQAAETLRRSELKFRTLFEATGDAVMLLDETGFFDCNETALRVMGCASPAELCALHPADLSPPQQPCGTDSRTLAHARIVAAQTVGSQHFEWVHRRADTGESFPAEVTLTALQLDGRPVLQTVVRDITEREQAEIEHAAIIATAPEGFLIADIEGRLLEVNDTYCRMSGYSREELLRLRIADLEAAEVREESARHLAKIAAQGYDQFETRHHRQDGSVFDIAVNVQFSRVRGGVFISFLQDITERKRAEVEHAAIITAALEGFFLSDREGRLIEVNDAYCRMSGYSRAELLTRHVSELEAEDTVQGAHS